jgi:hypothetical protein
MNLTQAIPLIFNAVYTTPRRILITNVLNTAQTAAQRQLLEDVVHYLLLAHKGQHRKGSTYFNPNNDDENLKYFSHQYMVWVQGYLSGVSFAEQIALLLHDTVEDGTKYFHPAFGKTRDIIRQDIITIGNSYTPNFGNQVIQHVDAMTNKKGLTDENKSWKENVRIKQAWQLMHFKGLPVKDQNNKLRDKLANMWDTVVNPPDGWSDKKKQNDMDFALELLEEAKNPPQYIADLLHLLQYHPPVHYKP